MLEPTIMSIEVSDLVPLHLQQAVEKVVNRFEKDRIDLGDDEIAVARALIYGAAQYLGCILDSIDIEPEERAELNRLYDVVFRAFAPPTMGGTRH
jgi:hypothetical protein